MKKSWAILLLVGVFLVACSKDDDDDGTDCVTEDITYTNTMKEYFDSGCTFSGCHNSGSINGGLASFDEAKFFVSFGRIVGAVKHDAGFSAMPRGRAMWDECMISQLETWIANGTPE